MMFGFGILGFALRRNDYPLAPLIMGVILGPICEANFRRSLLVSDDGAWVFLQRPISATILTVLALLALGTALTTWNRRLDKKRALCASSANQI